MPLTDEYRASQSCSDQEYMSPHYGWLSPEGEYHELDTIHTHEAYLLGELGLEQVEAEDLGWVHLSRSAYYHAAMDTYAKDQGTDKRLTSAQIQWLRKCGYEICRIDPCTGRVAAA